MTLIRGQPKPDAGALRRARGNTRRLKTTIDQRLAELIGGSGSYCRRLHDAIAYSLLAPGKRVRPTLAMLTAAHLEADPAVALDFGCALEMVHCASLILDDLPSMDNARLRRGRPALHRAHGEGLAVLAAVALLNQAYGVIAADATIADRLKIRLVAELSAAVGANGLVSGQSRDLYERGSGVSREHLERINHQKTGVLFQFAVAGGSRLAGVPEDTVRRMERFASRLGQAFQTADDLLDRRASELEAGKDVEQDRDKAGLVDLLGEDSAGRLLRRQLEDALGALEECDYSGRQLPDYVRALFRSA